MMKILKILFFALLVISFTSCNNDDDYVDISISDGDVIIEDVFNGILNLPEDSFNYANIQLPAFFLDNDLQNEDNTPNNNPITNPGATLGRVLFYDKKLSANNTIACASCHNQEDGFSAVSYTHLTLPTIYSV